MKIAVDVDETGSVKNAMVYVPPAWPCSSDADSRIPRVIEQAEKAARTWKFEPAFKNGRPIDSRFGLTILLNSSAPKEPHDTAAPKTVVGGVVNGKAVRLEKPAYPAQARQVRAGGPVSVEVLIDEMGKVYLAQAVSGSPYLMYAAREAACRSEFSPTLLQGKPVKVSGTIVYNFVP